jgi:hypothetical protein
VLPRGSLWLSCTSETHLSMYVNLALTISSSSFFLLLLLSMNVCGKIWIGLLIYHNLLLLHHLGLS